MNFSYFIVLPFSLIMMLIVSSCKPVNPSQEAKAPQPDTAVDVRDKLLETSKGLKDFPQGKDLKLMEFAYLGYVNSTEGKIYVVNTHYVLTGMLSPRGLGEIIFFDSKFNHLGSQDTAAYPPPAFCNNGCLFFYGRSDSLATNSGGTMYNGNALDLSKGWSHRKMIDVYEYGSSGGIQDPIPTQAERERERVKWDGGYEWKG